MNFALLTLLALGCVDSGLAQLAPAARPEASSVPAPAVAEAPAAEARPAPLRLAAAAAPTPAAAETTLPASAPSPAASLLLGGVADEEVVDRVLSALEKVTTLQGGFTQIAPSGAISTGKFWLRRPGLLRFEYDPPTPLLVVANGGMVFVRDEALETTDSYPVGQTPLKFLLRRKVELGDAQLVHIDRGVDDLAITFASKDAETEGEITLVVAGPELSLREWAIRDGQDGVTVVALENVIAGGSIANRLFQVPETRSPFLKN